MRILQISPQVPVPADDGGRLAIYGITKYLHQKGHIVDFVCYRKHSDYDFSFRELSKVSNPTILDVQTDYNIWGAFKNIFSNVPYNVDKYKTKEMEDFLVSYLKKNKPDVVHVDNLHMAWTINIIKRFGNIPVVLRQQNLEMMIMKRFQDQQKNPFLKFYSGLQYKKFISYEPQICEQFEKCLMITEEDEKQLLKLNPNCKTTFIPCGIESDLLEYPQKEKIPDSLFHVGQLNWLPNYDGIKWYLDEIFPDIIKAKPNVKLFIYGKGTEKLELPDLVKNNVILKGYVKDIYEEMADKELAVVPLRIGGGMRIKIVEFLSMGLNIISTPVGAEGISVTDGENILLANTKEEMINKTLLYLNNRYDKKELSINAKEFIKENYVWDKVITKFENTYRNLL